MNRILLVDDDHATNFLHRLILKELNLAEHIDIVLNGKEALDYIESCNVVDLPELILLDINMPYMDGFEFLEYYEKLHHGRKDSFKLFMLTTSVAPEDIVKAKKNSVLEDVLRKPLTEETLINLWDRHFNE